MPRRKLTWFHIKISGVAWTVKFKTLPGNLEGLCVYETGTIYISTKLARRRIFDVLYHELGHAVMFQSGADKALAHVVTGDDDAIEKAEELFISTFGQAMFQTFSGAGFIRLPEIPDWVTD